MVAKDTQETDKIMMIRIFKHKERQYRQEESISIGQFH